MLKRGYLQISFAWLFAIIVGIFILFLAIYASYKFLNLGQEVSSAETGKEIEIIANSIETGFESGKSTFLQMPLETRIRNDCDEIGDFGEQRIRIAQKNLGKWQEANIETSFENRYIFSDIQISGEKFYFFSKSIEIPFKIADAIYMTSSKDIYCFVNAPLEIKDEINSLNQKNLLTEDCPENSINICFDNPQFCDINVNENLKSVEKNNKVVYYETNSLMYSAIFSDKETYECQILRLMKRLKELSYLYEEKEDLLVLNFDCEKKVIPAYLGDSALSVDSSSELVFLEQTASEVNSRNLIAECRLW